MRRAMAPEAICLYWIKKLSVRQRFHLRQAGKYCGKAAAVGGYILFSIACASCIFLFAWYLVARKRITLSQFANVLNVALKNCFPGMYEPISVTLLGNFFGSPSQMSAPGNRM